MALPSLRVLLNHTHIHIIDIAILIRIALNTCIIP